VTFTYEGSALGQLSLHGRWRESAVSRRPRMHNGQKAAARRATVLGRHRAWRGPRPLDRLPYPVLRRGSRSKQRHEQTPATNNTFHTSGGTLTHASEGKARRVLKRHSNPWRAIGLTGCDVAQNHRRVPRCGRRLDSAALLRERCGGQRAEAHAAESGHRVPTVASSTVQHRFRHHCRHAS